MRDISPSLTIRSAETELALPAGAVPMGQKVGGISTFGNSFKRGSGSNTFGIDERGMWLGAADWDDAPFRVDMQGNMYFSAADGDGNSLVIDSQNLRIVLYVNNVPQALWGLHIGGF